MKWMIISQINIFLVSLMIIFTLSNAKLVGVVELMRHGARSPKSDVIKSNLFFGAGKFILTINGFQQHYKLGRWLRDKYIKKHKLLSPDYRNNEVEIISSETQRTIFSATAQLYGLFKAPLISYDFYNNKNQKLFMKFNQNPPIINIHDSGKIVKDIKIKILRLINDKIFRPFGCTLANKNINDMFESRDILNITNEEKVYFIEELNKILGTKLKPNGNNDKLMINIIDYVKSVDFHTKNMIKLSQKLRDIMTRFSLNSWYKARINDSDALKLVVSGFFESLVKIFTSMKEGGNTKKFFMFSGHDTNIINFLGNVIKKPLLIAMIKEAVKDNQKYDFLISPYASSMLLELHTLNNEYYIKIIYNGQKLDPNYLFDKNQLKDGRITLDAFLKLIQSRISKKWKTLDCKRRIVKK